MSDVKNYIRTIPNFPKEGIMFRDITSLLQDPVGLKCGVDAMVDLIKNDSVDVIIGIESRGFMFGMPIAYALGKAFVPARKKGKLPLETVSKDYDLEYGVATIELHKDSIKPGQRVVIVDDLMATGGTIRATIDLVEQLGGKVVKVLCLIELKGLEARKRLSGYDIESVVQYDDK